MRRLVIELVPMTGKRWRRVPVEIRFRRALKVLGRSFGLRCIRIETENDTGKARGGRL